MKRFFKSYYNSCEKQYDVFNCFVEKAYSLLREGGKMGFVLPNRFLTNNDYKSFREFLLNNTKVNRVDDIGEGYFKDVSMPSLLLAIEKTNSPPNLDYNVQVRVEIENLSTMDWKEYEIPVSNFKKDSSYKINIYLPPELVNIADRMEENSDPFKKYLLNARGVEIGKKHSIVSKIKSEDLMVPFLIGSDISRYQIKNNHYIKLDEEEINYKTPNLYKGEKIIIRKTGKGINATYDIKNHYVIQVIYILKLKDEFPDLPLLGFLAILNSKIMEWYYFIKFGEKDKKSFPHLRQSSILSLPMKEMEIRTKEYLNVLSKLAKIIIELGIKLNKTTYIDHEIIDPLVYKLYIGNETNDELLKYVKQVFSQFEAFTLQECAERIFQDKKLKNLVNKVNKEQNYISINKFLSN